MPILPLDRNRLAVPEVRVGRAGIGYFFVTSPLKNTTLTVRSVAPSGTATENRIWDEGAWSQMSAFGSGTESSRALRRTSCELKNQTST
jgi:hypothetical protein